MGGAVPVHMPPIPSAPVQRNPAAEAAMQLPRAHTTPGHTMSGRSQSLSHYVPHYNVFGHQHHKHPFRNMDHVESMRNTDYWQQQVAWGEWTY